MKRIASGTFAGLVAAALVAGPASGDVGVRVEGDGQTLLPRTAVSATGAAVGKPGQPTCAGTTALGALDRATGGDWAGPYDAGFQTYSLATLKGETHDAASSAYWAFWINYSYASAGVCGQPVQDGDELLFVPECYAAGCTPASPLRLSGVPATIAPGAPVAVRVEQYSPPVYPAVETTSAPAAGASVSFGGETVTTGADGTARVVLGGSGPRTVQATKPGHVRSATAAICVTNGADGACGTPLPGVQSPSVGTGAGPATPLGSAPRDTIAPKATLRGLKPGRTFTRRNAPRELRGSVSADPSGLLSVRLAVTRRRGGRCWAFDGGTERFERHRCGGWQSFKIGDRAQWSYLLPRKLARGRYTIRVAAIDRAGNDSVTRTRIRVR